MADKKLNTEGIDMTVFKTKKLNTEGVDLSVFGKDKVSNQSELGFDTDKFTKSFIAKQDVIRPEMDIKRKAEIIKQSAKQGEIPINKQPEEELKNKVDPKEQQVFDIATENVDKWYKERGGLTPQNKIKEFETKIKDVTAKYEKYVLSAESKEDLYAINDEFKNEVNIISDELGLEITEDGSVKPYDDEINRYVELLGREIRLNSKEKKDSYIGDVMDRLAAGTHSFTANMVDLAGFLTGANYFEGYKDLSEGQRFRAEQFREQSQRYDGTIQELAENGNYGEAAGLAVMSAVESLPMMLPMFANPTYGVYIMGAGAAMEKYREIENKDVPKWQKILDAVASGANEAIWEKAITVPILAKSKQAMLSMGRKRGKEIIKEAVDASLKNSAYKAGGSIPSWVAEGLSEVATGISNDIADKIYLDPETQIGSHAFDDMVVGAIIGKAFSAPSDIATYITKKEYRDVAKKALKLIPKDISYDNYMDLAEILTEREILTEMENNLAPEFKGKYATRIDGLNKKAQNIIGQVEGNRLVVGKTEEGDTEAQQAQLDYLKQRGVEVPEGTKMDELGKLYDTEVAKETAETEIDEAETPEQIEEIKGKIEEDVDLLKKLDAKKEFITEKEKLDQSLDKEEISETEYENKLEEITNTYEGEVAEKIEPVKPEVVESDFDKEGDLTDSGFEKATTILTSTIDEVSDKYELPKEVVKKNYNISEKGEYVSMVTPILNLGRVINEREFRKIVKDIAIALNKDGDLDKINRTVNSVFDDWLSSIENGTTFEAPLEMKKIFQALIEINKLYQDRISKELNIPQKETTVKSETEKKLAEKKTEISEIQPTETEQVEEKLPKKETVKEKVEEKLSEINVKKRLNELLKRKYKDKDFSKRLNESFFTDEVRKNIEGLLRSEDVEEGKRLAELAHSYNLGEKPQQLKQTDKEEKLPETVTPEYEKLTANLGIKGKTLTKSLGKSARNGKIGGVSVILQQGTKENEVILESIKTPKYQRGTGKATNAMNKIIAEADKQGLTIKLRAVPEKGADISQENLIKFYQDFGFEFKEGSIEGVRKPRDKFKVVENSDRIKITSTKGEVLAKKMDDGRLEIFIIERGGAKGVPDKYEKAPKGYGLILYKRLIEEARKRGYDKIYSSPGLITRGAVTIYERLEKEGYKITRHPRLKSNNDASWVEPPKGSDKNEYVNNVDYDETPFIIDISIEPKKKGVSNVRDTERESGESNTKEKTVKISFGEYQVNGISPELKKIWDKAPTENREWEFAKRKVKIVNSKYFTEDTDVAAESRSWFDDKKQPTENQVKNAMIWSYDHYGDYKIKAGGGSRSDNIFVSSFSTTIADPKTGLDKDVVIIKKYGQSIEDVLITIDEIQELQDKTESKSVKNYRKNERLGGILSLLIRHEQGFSVVEGNKRATSEQINKVINDTKQDYSSDEILNRLEKIKTNIERDFTETEKAGIIDDTKERKQKRKEQFDKKINAIKKIQEYFFKKKGVQDAEKIGTGVETPSRKEELEQGEEGQVYLRDIEKERLETEKGKKPEEIEAKLTPKQREEAAKAKIAEGFSNLAETIGAKKSLTGEERETAINAITRIIEGLIELGIAKGMSLKDAVRDYLKQRNYIIDEDLLDEAIRRREKPEDDFPIGTTNAKVRTSREMRGLDAIPKEERIGNEELWGKVVDKIDNGQIFPRQVVKEIVISDDVETSAMKEAIVKHDRWRILKETKYTNEEIIKKQNSQNKKGLIELFQRRVELENEMQENDLAAEKLGATWGRAGQFRQRNVEEDLSFEAIKREAKILNGGKELSIKQEQKFKELSEKYKELQKEYDKIREKERIREQKFKEEEEKKRKEAEQKLVNDIRNKVTPKSAKDFDTQFKSDFKRQKLSQKESDIKERLKERLSRLANVKFAVGEEGSSLIVEEISGVIQDMSELGIIKLEQGIDKIISKVKDYLLSINKNFDVKNLDKYKDEIKNKLGIPKIENAEYDELINKLVDKSQLGFDISVKGILKKILYNRVVAGSETIDDVVDDIYESVKDRIPNIDKRMIRDALSGYGEFRRLSKEEIDVKIRELKRQGRLDSAIEDVEDNRLPLRSGVERDKTTQETREKQARIIKEIKDRDLVPPPTQQDQETQWRNGLQAYQRRLENAIEDVKKEIDTGERKQRSKFKKYDTPELESLREELSRLREIRNAIDKETGRYAEQRESAIIKATERVIAEIEMDIDKLRRGVPIDKNVIAKRQGLFGLSKPMQEKFTSERIEELGKLKDALQQQLSELLPDAIKDKALLDKYKKQRQRRLEQLIEQQRTKDYGVKPKPYRPALDKEAIMINRDIEKLKYAIEKEKEQIRYKNMNLAERIGEGFINAWNIPKALMASIDLSAPMRQGIVMISKPKIFMKAFNGMFKYAFSEKIYEDWLFTLKTTDDYYEMIANDLYIAEPTAKLAAKEEDFMSNWLKYIDKIPLYGAVRVASERAYVGFLNKLRVDTYLNFKDKLQKQGFEAEELQNELKSYSHFINTATGRGSLKITIGNRELLNLEPIANLLNSAFFSPRLIASRIAPFNPLYWINMTKETRKDAVKTYLGTIGIIMSTLALSAIAFSGDDKFEIELDPRSSDFLKIRYGKIRFDLWGGHQQVARTLAQFITGKIKTDGEVKAMTGNKFYGQTRLKTLRKFFENKLSPSTALAKDLLQGGKNYEGEDITITNELINKTMPLYLQDVKEAVEEEGWEFAFIAGFPALFGVGVQTYKDREVDVNETEETEETERVIRGGY